MTVGQPTVIDPPWAVLSPKRAADMKPIITVAEPLIMVSGGPTQVAISPIRAAGMKPIITVVQPGGRIGPPTCGTGGVPGVAIGHVCISVTLAAGGIFSFSVSLSLSFRTIPIITKTFNLTSGFSE